MIIVKQVGFRNVGYVYSVSFSLKIPNILISHLRRGKIKENISVRFDFLHIESDLSGKITFGKSIQ